MTFLLLTLHYSAVLQNKNKVCRKQHISWKTFSKIYSHKNTFPWFISEFDQSFEERINKKT